MPRNPIPVNASIAWALALSASLGCGGAQKAANPTPTQTTVPSPQPSTSEPAKPPQIMLRLDGKVDGKDPRELQPGESLRSGDEMAINVAVDQPAYVYVAFASSAGGGPQVLYPKTGDKQVLPDAPLRIPANTEKWITLDKQTGQEDIFVYASSKPIPSAELLNLINNDAAAAKKAAAKKAAAAKSAPAGTIKGKAGKPSKGEDGALTSTSRGLQVEEDESESAAIPANPNIVVKRFSLTHK